MDLDIDLDFDDDDFESHEDSTRVLSMENSAPAPITSAPVPKLYVFEPGGTFIEQALLKLGVQCKSVESGSDLMGAADEGHVALVLMSPGMDEELRELFVRAFSNRFTHIPVVFITQQTQDREAVTEMLRQGARTVLPWPLPASSELLPFLDAYTPSGTSIRRAPVPSNAQKSSEVELLRKKVAKFERTSQRSISSIDFERAVTDAASQAAENTSLRSEMTLLRERAALLEERISRMQRDINVISNERDALLAHGASQQKDPSIDDDAVALLRGVESFVWPVEQAIQFFEDLVHEIGAKRAPSLNLHLRTLKLVKTLLERVRDRFNDPS